MPHIPPNRIVSLHPRFLELAILSKTRRWYFCDKLIEALPEIIDDKAIIRKLGNFPEYDPAERNWPSHYRKHVVARLNRMRTPLPEYIEVFRMLEQALFESYLSKNPFSPTTANWLHQLNDANAAYFPRTGAFQSNAQGMTVIGISGLGKTSMVLQIMEYFGDVISHQEYKGKVLKFKQIPMIYVKCSHDGSLKGFCESIITQLTARLGDTLKCANTLGLMKNQIESLVRRSFLGMLIVDDFQSLKIGKSFEDQRFLNFLLNLIDDVGVPILFISNPEGRAVLEQKFRISRRAEKLGYIDMPVLSKKVWDACFIDSVWRYQWTNKPTVCSSELNDFLFQISRGIIDIAVRIYMNAQRLVIGTHDETITLALLEQAFKKTCRLTENGLELLDPENKEINDLDDLQTPNAVCSPKATKNNKENFIGPDAHFSNSSVSPSLTEPENQSNDEIVGDLNRIHHFEFKDQLAKLIGNNLLTIGVKDFEVLRRCQLAPDPFEALADQNYIAKNPTKLF